MKVAIVGSREIVRYDAQTILRHLPKNAKTIISGGARGVDTLAENFALGQGFSFIKILPDYQKHGKKAPVLRNLEIVQQADYLLAIWDYQSRGTAHAIVHCIEQGVPVRILDADGCLLQPDPRIFEGIL